MPTDEVLDQEVVEAPEQNQQDDDAAFAAGFAEARGEEPPAPEVIQQEESAPEPEQEEVPEETPEPEPEPEPEETYAGLTKTQLLEALARANKAEEDTRKAFGKIGELQRTIQAIQQAPSTQAVELTKEDLADLAEDYPDLAEKIARGLNGKLRAIAAPQGPAFNPEEVEKLLDKRMTEQKQEYEMKLLTMVHPTWQADAASDEFSVWKGTQPKEVQDLIDTSWDAASLNRVLTDFKNWRDKSKEVKQERTSRLEAAIVPQGTPAATPGVSENDAFLAGWKTVRGR